MDNLEEYRYVLYDAERVGVKKIEIGNTLSFDIPEDFNFRGISIIGDTNDAGDICYWYMPFEIVNGNRHIPLTVAGTYLGHMRLNRSLVTIDLSVGTLSYPFYLYRLCLIG